MSFQQIPGGGLWVPNELFGMLIPPAFNNQTNIVATGDKEGWVGRVWFKERGGTKNIQTVGLRFGTVVKVGGSALTLSLQDVSLTAGPPMQPDGVQDQTVAISNASLASNAWLQTGNLSALRTVTYNDLLAVVVEYDGAGRLGGDSFFLTGINSAGASSARLQGQGVTIIGGVFQAFANIPCVVLGFDDGTFGTLHGGFPASALSTHGYGSTSGGADEFAIGLQFPFPCKISGVALPLALNTGADCSIILYQGTTALLTVSIDSNAVAAVSGPRVFYAPIPETVLNANTLYYLAVRPDLSNSVTIYYADVANAAHFQAHGGGMAFCEYSRVDGGAWSAAVTTRRPFISVELSAFDDGSGSGGGGATVVVGSQHVSIGGSN